MRVVSMVPSWTETLIRCGVSVVGRTRFCIHRSPHEAHQDRVEIPVVGGTKDWNLEKLRSLGPDLILLDKEENPKSMAEEAPCEVFATHVTSVADVARELERLSLKFAGEPSGDALMALARRWTRVHEVTGAPDSMRTVAIDWDSFPGVLEWIHRPSAQKADPTREFLAYVIWKNPWMCVGPRTFIASMLSALGWPEERLWWGAGKSGPSKYPEFQMDDVPEEAVLFFSSEPYPFHRQKEELFALGRPCAVVDGEAFSWFGIRSLEFLEKAWNLPAPGQT
jgi:hypothetical protein